MNEDFLQAVLPEERRLRIAAQLRRDTRVRVEDLVKQFAVSGETIRRDLQVLEERGMARRVYGGAVIEHPRGWQILAGDSQAAERERKRAIAALVATLIEPADTVIVDAGETVAEAARALPPSFAGRVLCSSLQIAAELATRGGMEVHLSGGELRPGGMSCVGATAEQFFAQFFADKALIAAGGVHPSAGVTHPHIPGNPVRQVMLRHCRDSYVLADHAKLGQIAAGRVCDVSAPTAIVTDSAADAETVRELQLAGATVLIAPPLASGD